MIAISKLVKDLQDDVRWQKTPEELTYNDYADIMTRAFRRLLVDTGRALMWDEGLIVEIIDSDLYEPGLYIDMELELDEIEYMLLLAKIEFFKKVQADVNNIVGYTTDALSITGADKPYSHIKDTIDDLENERRIVFYKMVRFVT